MSSEKEKLTGLPGGKPAVKQSGDTETGRMKKLPGPDPTHVIAGLVVALVLLIVAGIAIKNRPVKDPELDQKIAEGRAWLEELQTGDVQAYARKINDIAKEKRRAILAENPDAVWGAFNDAVILGDSRAVGFYTHDFIPHSRVFAKGGGKVTDIEEDETYLPGLKTMQPQLIFFCFGLNDVGIGFYKTGPEYAEKTLEEVNRVKEVCPNSEIYVCSILPAVKDGLKKDKDYPRIPEYNEALEAMCSENSIHYIDLTDLAMSNVELYQEDGLHVRKSFYILWATSLINEVE